MTRQEEHLKPGQILQGKYLIRERLGEGASGIVYIAEHLVLSSEIAVKVLHPRFSESELMRRRFLDEARTLARLKSRHVVRILDADLDASGIAFIAMEYVAGSDLERYIGERAPLPPLEAVRLALEVCRALEEAHGLGIVHRDIKPENILLAEDASGVAHVKVADFGLAKRVHLKMSRQSTSNDQPIGTPCYMAPEQMLRPADVDHRADVFSMGVLLYEMLTGFLPFGGQTVEETLQSVLSSEPTFASDLDERIPHELSELIQRCLVKNPEERLTSIVELIDELVFFQNRNADLDSEEVPLELMRSRTRSGSAVSTSSPAVISITPTVQEKSRWGVGLALGLVAVASLSLGTVLHSKEAAIQWSGEFQDDLRERLGLQLVEDGLQTAPLSLSPASLSFHQAYEVPALENESSAEATRLPEVSESSGTGERSPRVSHGVPRRAAKLNQPKLTSIREDQEKLPEEADEPSDSETVTELESGSELEVVLTEPVEPTLVGASATGTLDDE